MTVNTRVPAPRLERLPVAGNEAIFTTTCSSPARGYEEDRPHLARACRV
jgi:hypothetical protein